VKNFWSFYNDGSNIKNPTGNKPTPRIYNRTTDGQELNDPQVCEDYRDSLGEYWVCLEVESAIGCTDTICKKVYNDFKASIRPPNVFTPNTDNFTGVDKEGLVGNNVFNIEINGQVKYDLVIYDRWGVRVFESTDANKDWNGRVNNTGAICPDGTYYYILKYRYKGIDKDEEVLNGVVRIIR
jgi:gliding motility-associated-like protein